MRCVRNEAPNGFGFAVRKGLEEFQRRRGRDRDGRRLRRPARRRPLLPRARGRLRLRVRLALHARRGRARLPAHQAARSTGSSTPASAMLFRHGYNDTTNAFKAYRREVIENLRPLLSHHFNLTVELPLKAITRGFSYAIVPTSWTNRAAGTSKLQLNEMGSRYLFIVLYVFLEYHLSRGDYRRAGAIAPERPVRLAAPGPAAEHDGLVRRRLQPPPRPTADVPRRARSSSAAPQSSSRSSRSPPSRGGSPSRTRRSSPTASAATSWLVGALGVYATRAGRPRLALAPHHAAGRDPAPARRRLPAHARRLHGQQRAARARRRGAADRDPRLAHDRQAAHDPRLDHRRAHARRRRARRAVRGAHVVRRRATPRPGSGPPRSPPVALVLGGDRARRLPRAAPARATSTPFNEKVRPVTRALQGVRARRGPAAGRAVGARSGAARGSRCCWSATRSASSCTSSTRS